MIEITFYRTDQDQSPVQVFLDSLNPKQVAKVLWTLQAIQSLDPVPAQYLQKMTNTNDLWEVRVVFGGDCFRLLGFYNRAGHLVLCHGFAKKTQKTPRHEIAVAEARKVQYEKR